MSHTAITRFSCSVAMLCTVWVARHAQPCCLPQRATIRANFRRLQAVRRNDLSLPIETGAGAVVTIDELITCASRRQDVAGPSNCLRLENEVKGRFSPSAIRLCRHHVDGRGVLIFEDAQCALRTRAQEGASVENVDVSGDTAFFDRHMTNAVKHVAEAELAGLQTHQPEMLRHAELALDHAKEAQREGNVPRLMEGLVELREALRHRPAVQWENTLDHIRHARVALSPHT